MAAQGAKEDYYEQIHAKLILSSTQLMDGILTLPPGATLADEFLPVQLRKMHVLEEMDAVQRNIQEYDKASMAGRVVDASESADEWYARHDKILSGLRDELMGLRLLGDRFRVHRGMGRTQPFWLFITAQSQLLFCDDVPDSKDSTRDHAVIPFVVGFVDQLVKFYQENKLLPETKTSRRESVVSAGQTEVPQNFRLKWRNGVQQDLLITPAAEFNAVAGSHVNRYNRAKAAQLRRMAELLEQKVTPFSIGCPHHENLAAALWAAVWPNVAMESRTSYQWRKLGFTTADPVADLGPTGLIGLQTLLFVADRKPALLQAMTRSERRYPFAQASLALTLRLFDVLQISEAFFTSQSSDTPLPDSALLAFFCYLDHEYAFEETHCVLLLLLDELFMAGRGERDKDRDRDFKWQDLLQQVIERFGVFLQGRPVTQGELIGWAEEMTRSSTDRSAW